MSEDLAVQLKADGGTLTDLIVLHGILRIIDASEEDIVPISTVLLADLIGMHRASVQRSALRLAGLGYVTRRVGAGGYRDGFTSFGRGPKLA